MSTADGELADVVFAEADRQASQVPRLPLVVLQAATEAAGRIGNQTSAQHYLELRDAEQRRIDVEQLERDDARQGPTDRHEMIDTMGGHQLGYEELLTTRSALRRPTSADIDAIYRIHHDPAACAHNPADMLTTRADAEDLYRRWDQHWHRHGFGYWVIHPREADVQYRPLGFCGLKLMRLQDQEVLNLFYRLDPAAWGNGMATEAATSVVSWATTHLPDRPIIARVRPDNLASATVAERTGLQRAPHLDTAGEDGLDWIFAKNWIPGRRQSPGSPARARD